MGYAILIFAGLAGFYAFTYYLNSLAPIPEGAEIASEGCRTCSVSTCEIHPSKRIKEVN
ncbi:MAG TPA: hypothetical protein VFC83_03445 [Erysipelotrichaceae bacterium]|nr:hypothetical protein [Erysipelotrichaceae bacterium]